MSNNILVSIRCAVYNHEKYLRQCLDGFIMQKTNFRYEVIIHDDASTDKSAEIIKEYTKKYPEIFKPIFQKENLFSKNKDAVRKVLDAAMNKESKYVALCEGDDYWISPNKLQTQIDFLENNPEYSFCFHNAINHWEDNSKPDTPIMKENEISREYSADELYNKWFYATASFVFRKDVLYCDAKKEFERYSGIVGDVPLILSATTIGKVYGMTEIMSVYRRHKNGWSMKNNFSTTIFKSDLIEALIIKGNLPRILKKRLEKSYIHIALNNAIFMHDREGLKFILKNYPAEYWLSCFKGSCVFFINALKRKFKKIVK